MEKSTERSLKLERLAEAQDAVLAVASDVFEVDLERYQLLAAAGLVEHRTLGTGQMERPLPPSPTPLMSKTKHWLVTAVARATPSSTSRSIVPVRVGRRITSLDDGQRARGLREPHVVADVEPETADVWHVEDQELVAGGDAEPYGSNGNIFL